MRDSPCTRTKGTDVLLDSNDILSLKQLVVVHVLRFYHESLR